MNTLRLLLGCLVTCVLLRLLRRLGRRHRAAMVALLLSLAAVSPALAQPAQVILLRHAEKPEDKEAVHLSPRGEERARALPALLGRGSALTRNAPVVALFATRVSKHEHGSRTGETLAPLSTDLGLPANAAFDSENYAAVARSILHNRAYRGSTVIVCWTHHEMAQLAGALGVRPPPAPWRDKVFDRLWVISYASGKAVLTEVPQHLLNGDARK